MTESTTILRRYTDLASLVDIIQTSEITLLPPSGWDDRNDRLMMETYKSCKKLQTLLALCLTRKGETYHHWKVFADNSNGVCIHFKRPQFTLAMKSAGVNVGTVRYLKIDELDSEEINIRRLPYCKRLAFRDEGEIRAVYENVQKENVLKRVPISLDIIEKVSLSPWMPKTVAASVITMLENLSVQRALYISQSNLIDARGWRQFAEKYKRLDMS
jgi:hypothetical protein